MQKKKAQDNLNPQSKLIIKQRSKNVLSHKMLSIHWQVLDKVS